MARPLVTISNLERRLPEQGRIRFGEKGPKGEPRKLSTFRFTSRDEAAVRQLADLYGGTPTSWDAMVGQWQVTTEAAEIPVVLPPDPLGGSPVYELWAGGGVLRRCDGEVCLVPRKTAHGAELAEVPCMCEKEGVLTCKPITRLTVLLPDVRFGGGWRIESGGWNVAHELPGMVEMISELQERGMMRATLALEARTSKMDGKTRNFMVPVLRPAFSVNEILAGQGSVLALGVATDLQALGEGAGGREASERPEMGLGPSGPSATPSSDDDIVDAQIVGEGVGASPLPPTSDDLQHKRMHAMLRELGMGTVERHALVKRATKGRSTSSKELDRDELQAIVAALATMKNAKAFYEGEDGDGMAIVVTR